MKIAIHQPNYLPWTGYFKKMAMSDIFVILDTIQFSKDSYTQRTKIRTKDGWMWLTIPIEKDNHFKPIKDVQLPRDTKWLKKHMTSIVSNYSKSGFYDREFIENYYTQELKTLQEFNEAGILYLKKKLGINAKIVRASELGIDPGLKSTDLILEIVKKTGGDTYISGAGGEKYMELPKFDAEKITLEFSKFQPSEYAQRWDGFEPYMSAIDLVYNTGEEWTNEHKNACQGQ
jgi:hypothetical protein